MGKHPAISQVFWSGEAMMKYLRRCFFLSFCLLFLLLLSRPWLILIRPPLLFSSSSYHRRLSISAYIHTRPIGEGTAERRAISVRLWPLPASVVGDRLQMARRLHYLLRLNSQGSGRHLSLPPSRYNCAMLISLPESTTFAFASQPVLNASSLATRTPHQFEDGRNPIISRP